MNISFRRLALGLALVLLLLPALAHERSDSVAARALRALNVPFTHGNQAHLLPTGHALFADMMEQIARAKRYVHIEFYKFYNDSIGQATLSLLRQKVTEGVEVKIIVDGFSNTGHPASFSQAQLEALGREGIHMVAFDPMRFPYITKAYHRDHRKIITIDGHTAYIGGMNIADYYIHGKPQVGHWADMHMRMHGPCVAEYERQFQIFWHKCTGEQLQLEPYLGPNLSTDSILMGVVSRYPGPRSGLMRQAYAAAINAAQHHIRIVNAYPTLTRTVRSALYHALERGVRVEIMLSANNDQQLTPLLMGRQMKILMDRGAEIYYYEGGFHHAKVMTVDDTYCTVGTANLDARSLMFDYEINAFMFHPGITARLNDIYEHDKLSRCERLTPQRYRQRFTRCQRIKARTLGLLNAFV